MKNPTNSNKTFKYVALASVFFISCFGCKTENKKGFKFDTMVPVIIPKSNYIMLGDKFQAKIGIRAYSSTMPMELKIDSNPNQSFTYQDGTFDYEIIADKEGPQTLHGQISIGGHSYPFETTYIVAKPIALIVPSELVLYRGKENKLDISLPGFSSADLSALATNCKITGGNGKYVLIPGKENTVAITVMARMPDGGWQKMDEHEYPVEDK